MDGVHSTKKTIPSFKSDTINQMTVQVSLTWPIHIMNLKSWLRGINHHCSKERVQGYLDEYHYRYNRGNYMGSIFYLLIKRIVENKPKRLKSMD